MRHCWPEPAAGVAVTRVPACAWAAEQVVCRTLMQPTAPADRSPSEQGTQRSVTGRASPAVPTPGTYCSSKYCVQQGEGDAKGFVLPAQHLLPLLLRHTKQPACLHCAPTRNLTSSLPGWLRSARLQARP